MKSSKLVETRENHLLEISVSHVSMVLWSVMLTELLPQEPEQVFTTSYFDTQGEVRICFYA